MNPIPMTRHNWERFLNMKKLPHIWRVGFGLAIASQALGCAPNLRVTKTDHQNNASSNSATSELPKVAIVKPVRKTLTQKTEQPGRIDAFNTTPIHAKVSGYVAKLLVDIGDRVQGPRYDAEGNVTEPGQLLVRLSAPELDEELKQKQASVQQVEAEIAQAKAAVEVAKVAYQSTQATIDQAKAHLVQRAASLDKFQSELVRMESLVASQTVSSKIVDETRSEAKSAEASKLEAEAELRLSQSHQQEAQIAVVKAQADLDAIISKRNVAQADWERTQSMHRYLEIRAPYDGTLTERHVDLGELIQAARSASDTPLFVIVQADTLRLAVEVPEVDAALVSIGSQASVRIPALGNQAFQGKVARTSWALQSSNRTLRCEIDIPNADGKLRPGMYAQLELTVAERQDTLALPKTAILQQDGQHYCLVRNEQGTLERRNLQVGIRSNSEIEVLAGVQESDSVVASNGSAFKAGQSVAVNEQR